MLDFAVLQKTFAFWHQNQEEYVMLITLARVLMRTLVTPIILTMRLLILLLMIFTNHNKLASTQKSDATGPR